jgi:hypothetical protein
MIWKRDANIFGLDYGLVITAVISFLVGKTAFSEGFQANGMLNIKYLDERTNVTQQQAETFAVSVQDCKWFITTAPLPYTVKNDIVCWEIGSEGSNEIYQVTKFNKQTLRSDSINNSVGVLDNDMVPDNIAGNNVSELWLALASSCYLDSVTNNVLEPAYKVMNPALRGKTYVVKAEWKRFDFPPRLPQRVTYTEDHIEGSYNGKIISRPAPHPFENGYTRAEYEALSFTNIGALILPMEFSFKDYAIVRTSKSNSHLVMYRIVDGYVTNVQQVCERSDFIPQLTDATYVDDRRFAKLSKPIISMPYMVTNRTWPQMNSLELQTLYKEDLSNQEAFDRNNINATANPSVRETKIRRLCVILFIILSLFPLGMFIQKTLRSRGKT